MQVDRKVLIGGGVAAALALVGVIAYFATSDDAETTPGYITGGPVTPATTATTLTPGTTGPLLANTRGELDLAKAMTALFGNYDAQQRTASWNAITPPSRAKPFNTWAGVVEGRVEMMLAQGYIENGQQKLVLVTRTTPMSYGQAASSTGQPSLFGVFVYRFNVNDWQLEKENRYLDALSQFETAAKVTLVKTGTINYGLLLEGSSQSRDGQQLFARLADVSGQQIRLISDRLTMGINQEEACQQESSDQAACANLAGGITFVKGKHPDYYDFKLVFTGIDAEGNPAQQTDRYTFSKSRYRLVASSASVQTTQPAPAAATPAEGNTAAPVETP